MKNEASSRIHENPTLKSLDRNEMLKIVLVCHTDLEWNWIPSVTDQDTVKS